MARHHNAEGKQRNNISKRLSRVEAQVKELTKTGPPRPEDTVAREARKGERADFLRTTRDNANFETPVRDHLARLKGRSTSHVADDRTRRRTKSTRRTKEATMIKNRWSDKTYGEKQAAAVYPGLIDAQTRREMIAANPEQSAGLQRRMSEGDKLYGKPSEPPKNYDHVPTLRRKVVRPRSRGGRNRSNANGKD